MYGLEILTLPQLEQREFLEQCFDCRIYLITKKHKWIATTQSILRLLNSVSMNSASIEFCVNGFCVYCWIRHNVKLGWGQQMSSEHTILDSVIILSWCISEWIMQKICKVFLMLSYDEHQTLLLNSRFSSFSRSLWVWLTYLVSIISIYQSVFFG